MEIEDVFDISIPNERASEMLTACTIERNAPFIAMKSWLEAPQQRRESMFQISNVVSLNIQTASMVSTASASDKVHVLMPKRAPRISKFELRGVRDCSSMLGIEGWGKRYKFLSA